MRAPATRARLQASTSAALRQPPRAHPLPHLFTPLPPPTGPPDAKFKELAAAYACMQPGGEEEEDDDGEDADFDPWSLFEHIFARRMQRAYGGAGGGRRRGGGAFDPFSVFGDLPFKRGFQPSRKARAAAAAASAAAAAAAAASAPRPKGDEDFDFEWVAEEGAGRARKAAGGRAAQQAQAQPWRAAGAPAAQRRRAPE